MAMNATLAVRRKAREKQVEAGGHSFTIERPKAADMASRDWTRIDLIKRFVIGWDLKNIDLVPGGNPEPEPFDAALFADWIDDQPDLWELLSQAILAEWSAYRAAQETAAKN